MKICAFTKSFQQWSIAEVCRRFREIGLDGLDLTVRPRGHIEPKDAAEQLPLAARTALEAGTEILTVTSSITDPTPEAERLLATVSKLGITRIRLGYYFYKPFGTLARQMDDVRRRIAGVLKMTRKYSVLPCVHTHSGPFIPSHGTQLYELIRDFPPDEVGANVDTLHMVLEGGRSGWQQGLDLLAPWLSLVAVKNFAWEQTGRDRHGQLRWRTPIVPIADGVSPLPEFVGLLKKIGYDGICSLHSEYRGSHSFKDMDTEACLAQTAEDLKFLKKLLA